MTPSACCLLFGRALCEKQTTTRGRGAEFVECVKRPYVLSKTIDGKDNRTFAGASQWPALICKTIETVVAENEMVVQPDAEQVSSVPLSCGERPIHGARRGIPGGMVGGSCYSPDDLRNVHVDAFLKCRVREATLVSCGLRRLRRAQVQFASRRLVCQATWTYSRIGMRVDQ